MSAIRDYSLILFALAILGATGCAENKQAAPSANSQVTSLELRDYQTEKIDTNDVALVMKVLFDVLRDEGYVVGTFNKELGLVNASKPIHYDKRQDARQAFSDLGVTLKHTRSISLNVNATIAQFGGGCKVRVVFQVQTLRSSGAAKNSVVVESPQYYRSFFEKLRKGLFLENQNL